MLTESEKKRLDRIESKLDRLLLVLLPSPTPVDVQQVAAYTNGGVAGLKAYQRAKVEAERMLTHA